MRKNILVLASLLIVIAMTSSGCAGLFLWEKGHYYHSEAMDSATVAAKDIRTVGVYTFSDGEAVEHTMMMGLSMYDWPSDITPTATFDPDTSLAGPSLELSNNLVKLLDDKGYNAKVVTDVGHNHEVSVEECLKHAQSHSYDGALIVYYKGIKNWQQDMGTVGRTMTIMEHNGFLYIPNAAFYEAKSGDQIWKNCYYGLVENAHLPNLANQSFVKVVEKSMVENDAETYIQSAPKAAKVLMEPDLFPGTTKPFPSKGEKKHRM